MNWRIILDYKESMSLRIELIVDCIILADRKDNDRVMILAVKVLEL
jgi:hypothetical protein